MTISKYKAVIVVFFVGFALGLSVFVASRLFVRSILSSDAIAAAEELAASPLSRTAHADLPTVLSGTISNVSRNPPLAFEGSCSSRPWWSRAAMGVT